jgi:homoserine acetyltransferase
MKTMKTTLAGFGILLMIATLTFNTAIAQNPRKERQAKKAAEVREAIEAKRYSFNANYMTPLRGGGKALTSEYEITIKGDSLASYLPYYGNAYVAPIDPTKNVLDFKSTKSFYTAELQKKGGWEISIILKDNRDVLKMFLSISPDGYATLRVTLLNQDPISFDGTIEPIIKKKEKV